MSVRISKSGEHVQQGTVIYTADTESDISSLPIGCTPGSTCFCIETSTTYILNNQGEWKVKTSSGGEEGGGSAYPSADARNFPIENDNLTFTTKSKNYNDITKAINQRAGTTSTYSPGQIADAITNLPTPTYQQKSLTPDFSNGNVDVSADTGYDALSEVTIQKDSNLTAENIKKDVTVHGITGSYEGGGGTNPLKAYLERTATTIDDNILENIGAYAFAFYATAFGAAESITSATFRNVENIQKDAFSSCTDLLSATFPKVKTIGGSAFNNCSSLTSISFPEVTSIINNTFYGCRSLTSISFPEVTSIVGNAFEGCRSLTSVDFPKVTSIGNGAFMGCTALTLIDFPEATSIGSSTFQSCSSFSILILRKDSMITLSNINAFSNTPFASGKAGGTLYVPQSLITTYQNDSKWGALLSGNENNQILAIEGSIYENV